MLKKNTTLKKIRKSLELIRKDSTEAGIDISDDIGEYLWAIDGENITENYDNMTAREIRRDFSYVFMGSDNHKIWPKLLASKGNKWTR